MPNVWEEIWEKIKQLLGGWASLVALGTFLLYLLGYLSTRYYLTVLGIGTDLTVLDERYFFAGARFLVYLLSTIPVLVLFALVPAAIIAIFRKLISRGGNRKPDSSEVIARIQRWSGSPSVSAIVGIVISTILIQTVMRQSFYFSNLLLAKSLYETEMGFERLLMADGGDLYWFFMALVAGTILTASIWVYARSRESQTPVSRFATWLLAFFVLVQFLFLPINYGVYIQDRYLPRVADLGNQVPLKAGQRAWLVWEGTHTFTYFVLESPNANSQTEASEEASALPIAAIKTALPSPAPSEAPASTPAPVSTATAAASPASTSAQPTLTEMTGPVGRKLVSLQQKDLKGTTILEYDHLFRLIFNK
jgi:hypothetical protein